MFGNSLIYEYKSAIISVSDKKKLNDILKVLRKYKIKLISSGGTFKKIKSLGYDCIEVSNLQTSQKF